MFNRKEKHVTDSDAIRSLPTTRKEVFFDLLKNRKMYLFALSCFTFMFFIPLAVDLFYFNFLEMAAIATNPDNLEKVLFSLIFYSMLIMLPCMVIGFIGLSGAFYVAKKLVWQESTSLANDFFTGIKENWKHGFINGAIFSIFLFGLIVGGSYLLVMSPTTPIWCGVGIGALILVFILFGIVNALTFTQDVYYSNSYGVTMKNAFCFLGLLNWRVFLLFIFTTGLVVGLGCINFVTLAVGLFLFAILNSVVIILYTLMSHSVFDKYINKEYYPDMVDKGLYKGNKEA